MKEIDETKLYFALPNGIGDTLLMGSIHHLLEEKYAATIVFIVKKSHSFILDSLEIKNYQVDNYSRDELFAISKKCSKPAKGKIFVAHPTFHDNGNLDKLFLQHQIEFVEMHGIFFGIPLKRAVWAYRSRAITSGLLERVKKSCNTDNLQQVVLFAPEMNSGAEYEKLQPSWAKKIFENLKVKYNHVIYNSTKKEFISDNHMDFSLEEIVLIGMNCRKVITARSGLADVLCGNINDMYVIYPNIGFYDLFRLDHMWENVSSNVTEYVFKLSDYLERHGYSKICIYGYGEGGDRIRYSLEKEGYIVEYAVDKKQEAEDIKIYRPTEKLPKVDIMIVCVNDHKENIAKCFKYNFDGAIVEMREIMEEMIIPEL